MWREDWEGARGRALMRTGAVSNDRRRTRPAQDESANKDRCEENFSKTGQRPGSRPSLPHQR